MQIKSLQCCKFLFSVKGYPVIAGVGKALATEFLRAGDSVVICSRSGAPYLMMKDLETSAAKTPARETASSEFKCALQVTTSRVL